MLGESRVERSRGGVVGPALTRHTVYTQQLFECVPKIAVEVGVDERVQTRVEVADPKQHGPDNRRVRASISAHGGNDVPGEEGAEAENEGPHDDAQSLGSLVLALHPLALRPLHLAVTR